MSQIKADTVRFVVFCVLCCQESLLLSTIACVAVRVAEVLQCALQNPHEFVHLKYATL